MKVDGRRIKIQLPVYHVFFFVQIYKSVQIFSF